MGFTVLAVSNCVDHDDTSYAVLKHVEVEFWCGTCRCDTWTHNVQYTGSMLRLPILVLECSKGRQLQGAGGMPNRREIWLFEGLNMDEIGWNFYRRILTPWPTIFTRIHSPGPSALWASMQKNHPRVERLLHSVKQQKESDRVTLWVLFTCQSNTLCYFVTKCMSHFVVLCNKVYVTLCGTLQQSVCHTLWHFVPKCMSHFVALCNKVYVTLCGTL